MPCSPTRLVCCSAPLHSPTLAQTAFFRPPPHCPAVLHAACRIVVRAGAIARPGACVVLCSLTHSLTGLAALADTIVACAVSGERTDRRQLLKRSMRDAMEPGEAGRAFDGARDILAERAADDADLRHACASKVRGLPVVAASSASARPARLKQLQRRPKMCLATLSSRRGIQRCRIARAAAALRGRCGRVPSWIANGRRRPRQPKARLPTAGSSSSTSRPPTPAPGLTQPTDCSFRAQRSQPFDAKPQVALRHALDSCQPHPF